MPVENNSSIYGHILALSQDCECYECRSRNKSEMISLFLLKASTGLPVTHLHEQMLPDHSETTEQSLS